MDWEVLLRLVVSMIIGGAVGFERETGNRPAGFRTHTLVCMGACIVMLTSEYVFETYEGLTSFDPTRMGAQVISGIGFLGAGTILKTGFSVKGLTTAASLWVVACIGLAIGVGFYYGAVAMAVLVYVTLILLKKVDKFIYTDLGRITVKLTMQNRPGQIGLITQMMGKHGIQIKDIKLQNSDDLIAIAEFLIQLPPTMTRKALVMELAQIDGVSQVDAEQCSTL
jgi:putative Mg2+ transporter-C (MgtC) family protein